MYVGFISVCRMLKMATWKMICRILEAQRRAGILNGESFDRVVVRVSLWAPSRVAEPPVFAENTFVKENRRESKGKKNNIDKIAEEFRASSGVGKNL
jgi:hypothetical protein